MHIIIIIIRVSHIILLLGSVTGYNHSPRPLVLLIPPLHWVYSYLPSTGSTPASPPLNGSTPPSPLLALLPPSLHWVPPLHYVYSSLPSTGSTPTSPPLGLLPLSTRSTLSSRFTGSIYIYSSLHSIQHCSCSIDTQ